MLKMKDYQNTYWNGNGKYQKFMAHNLEENLETLPISNRLLIKYKKIAHTYYRFYNDGDMPRHNAYKDVGEKQMVGILEHKINAIIEEIIAEIAIKKEKENEREVIEKCIECEAEYPESVLFEVDFDIEINGVWKIKSEFVCEKCFFEIYDPSNTKMLTESIAEL